MKYNILLIFGILLFTQNLAFTQEEEELSHKIFVYDALDRKGIEDVHVYNKSKSFMATSDKEGYITLKGTPESEEYFTFQHIAYEDQTLSLTKINKMKFQVELFPKDAELPEIVIAAGKIKEKLDEITNKVDIIKSEDVKINNPATSADLLQHTGNVYVQKSQQGGGSPVIRGFEANKVLIVVDGVRMNNAIFRGGHVQNVITIDNNMLERTEVVYGPGSVIYGSDALGGVMHFFSRKPAFTGDLNDENGEDKKMNFAVNAMARYSSATNERTAHVNIDWGTRNFGSLTGITYSKFGNTIIGEQRFHDYDDWGKRYYYVERIDGKDSLIVNENENELYPTGYDQMDFLQKLRFRLSDVSEAGINIQHSSSSDIPRFDRLNDPAGDEDAFDESGNETGLKFAEWNYGPQKRWLFSGYLQTEGKTSMYDNAGLVVAYQKIDEDRIDRKFGKTERRYREEDVQVYSLNLDFSKSLNFKNDLQYGLEGTHNIVNSKGYLKDINTDEVLGDFVLTRYPNAGSTMSTMAAYIRHKWRISPKWILTDGLRYSHIFLKAVYQDNIVFQLPYNSLQGNYGAVTGSIGLVYKAGKQTHIKISLASGFRAPNIDDAAKIFDPNDFIVVVPNFDLQPEYAYNAELGLTKKIGKKLNFNADVYYTYLNNLITRRPFSMTNGQDSLWFDDSLRPIYTNVNAGKGLVYGFALGAKLDLTKHIRLEKKFNYTKGRDLTNDLPLGHIPPFFGQFKIKYHGKKLESLFSIDYNGKKPIEQYGGYMLNPDTGEVSTNSEDKANEATPEGTPGWWTLNFRSSYQLNEYLQFTVGIDNLLDVHYKPFASGVSAPGRNFIMSIRSRF